MKKSSYKPSKNPTLEIVNVNWKKVCCVARQENSTHYLDKLSIWVETILIKLKYDFFITAHLPAVMKKSHQAIMV